MSVTQKAEITRALMRLGSARREKLDPIDFETFVDGLLEFETEDVAAVCRHLGHVTPGEYQPRFPSLSVLRQACIERQRARQATRLALAAPSLDAQYPPLSAEKWAHIRRLFDRVLGRRTMLNSDRGDA